MDHPHRHLDVEGVTGPIGHILGEGVLGEDDVRVVPEAEVRLFDMDHASRRADVLPELVPTEDHRPAVALNHEGRD